VRNTPYIASHFFFTGDFLMNSFYALVIASPIKYSGRLHRTLAQAGYQVQCVTTGSRAQIQLAFTNPDLIVLDLDLPDIPGEVILRQIKAQSRLDHTHLILLSEDTHATRDTQDLADIILSKPVSIEKLGDLAAQLLPV
jgi:DNA-binding response OmpR family regulator